MVAKQVMYMNFGSMPGLGGDDSSQAGSEASQAKDEGIKMGLDNSYSMGFSASLPLIAPQLWKSLSLSDSQILRSVETARQSRQNLVDQVKTAYYSLLLAIDSKEVIQESYEMARLT
ncbi:MAG: TolC family protein, partial [Muribaculaceae bacterium]|nr:TolC family protein [Muribaculaceae bacterium]